MRYLADVDRTGCRHRIPADRLRVGQRVFRGVDQSRFLDFRADDADRASVSGAVAADRLSVGQRVFGSVDYRGFFDFRAFGHGCAANDCHQNYCCERYCFHGGFPLVFVGGVRSSRLLNLGTVSRFSEKKVVIE